VAYEPKHIVSFIRTFEISLILGVIQEDLKAVELYVLAGADRDVLQEASRLDLESELRNLCQCQEVISANINLSSQLEALRQTNDLVNPARRILLGS
jgi:hypothetical protein